jgi:hypothetical protein
MFTNYILTAKSAQIITPVRHILYMEGSHVIQLPRIEHAIVSLFSSNKVKYIIK